MLQWGEKPDARKVQCRVGAGAECGTADGNEGVRRDRAASGDTDALDTSLPEAGLVAKEPEGGGQPMSSEVNWLRTLG